MGARMRAALFGLALVSITLPAHAEDGRSEAIAAPRLMVLPSLYLTRSSVGGAVQAAKPPEDTARRLDELTQTLRDAATDFGYEVELLPLDPPFPEDDADLLRAAERDRTTYVIAALEIREGRYRLRVAMASPGRAELRVRFIDVNASDVPAKGLVLLRALLRQHARDEQPSITPAPTSIAPAPSPQPGLRAGRALLAANGGVLGALTAFSVQRASDANDPRVVFPLLTLGAGVGLAGGLIIADELELDASQSLYLASGAWWGAGAAVLVANGREVNFADRYLWGVAGGATFAMLTGVWSTRRKMDEGALTLENSGALLGATLGGMVEGFAEGTTRTFPSTGAGIGAMVGLATAAGFSAFVKTPASRVLFVDLGAAVGGLGAAALASPLLFETSAEGGRTRGFFAATAAGTLAGGALAWYFTRKSAASVPLGITPNIGVIGASPTREGAVPAWGVGVAGSL